MKTGKQFSISLVKTLRRGSKWKSLPWEYMPICLLMIFMVIRLIMLINIVLNN